MKTSGRSRSFVTSAALICLGGLVIMALFTAFFAYAQSTTPVVHPATTAVRPYVTVGSFGITGMPTLTIHPTTSTPSFISDPLKQKRGIVLLVYVPGAVEDEAMKTSFDEMRRTYAAQANFYSFQAHSAGQLGDVMDQLQTYSPPLLAIIQGDGTVVQLYGGWIGEEVMEQRVANALRQ